jgi:hypothetical protein
MFIVQYKYILAKGGAPPCRAALQGGCTAAHILSALWFCQSIYRSVFGGEFCDFLFSD